MEKKMEHEMETREYMGIILGVIWYVAGILIQRNSCTAPAQSMCANGLFSWRYAAPSRKLHTLGELKGSFGGNP